MALSKKGFPIIAVPPASAATSSADEAAQAVMGLGECIGRALARHPDLAAGGDLAASKPGSARPRLVLDHR